IAQALYEDGHITYMRTDSVEMSSEAHSAIKEVIMKTYGEKYYRHMQYKTKSTSSQEAHEAIRPVHPEITHIDNASHQKLYKLIWKRTIASQMSPALIDVTEIIITISETPDYIFKSQSERIIFDGFMKVYVESSDDPEREMPKDGPLPEMGSEL